jgi:uncharacterized OB-fold protein
VNTARPRTRPTSVSEEVSCAPLPVPALADDPVARRFWDAVEQGRLLLERCSRCQTVIWYPRGFCPRCGSAATDWIEASGHGTVYSYTVVRKSFGAFAPLTPYVVAYIELTEGPRILSNVVDVRPDEVAIGLAVELTIEKPEGSPAVYRFRPASGQLPDEGGPAGSGEP